MNHTQLAAKQIADAIVLLKQAKRSLLMVRSDQHIHVAVQLASLEDIHGILVDPECTPANNEDPEYDDCVWDGNRIEATKSLLFHEHVVESYRKASARY